MRPMDNDPKGNDPIDRDPTNEEIVGYLRRVSLHFAFFKDKAAMDQSLSFHQFEFRTEVGGTPHIFEAQFENLATFPVMVSSTEESLAKYPRGNALVSLLYRHSFKDVEAFAVACRNALGDNIETVDLARSIFVNGKCVDELLDAIEDKRFAKIFVEQPPEPPWTPEEPPSPPEDKTDDKGLASEGNPQEEGAEGTRKRKEYNLEVELQAARMRLPL